MPQKKKTPSSKKSTNKVMDVAKPGKTAPSASSRPIIVGHKPTVKDPMVSEDKEMADTEQEEHKIEVKRSGPKVIAPLSSAEELAEAKESKVEVTETEEPAKEAESAAEIPESEATPETPEEEAAAEEPVEETSSEEPEGPEEPAEDALESETSDKEPKDKKDSKNKGSSIVDAVAGQAAKSKDKKADKKNEELQKRLAAVEKLVDDKKYFVKTSSTTKRERRTRWAVIILAFLLLAGGYLVVDAQVFKNDLWLPYHFFKEEPKEKSESSSQAPSEDSDDANDNAQEESEGNMEEGEQKPTAKELDADRKVEVKNIQQFLETFYNDNGYYPSFAQLNDKEYRQANSLGMSDDAITDPEGTNATFANTPTSKAYSYEVMPKDCDNGSAQCTSYVVTAVLSDSDDADADSSGNYVVKSVNQ